MAASKELSRRAIRQRQVSVRRRKAFFNKIIIGLGIVLFLGGSFFLVANGHANVNPPVIGQPMSDIRLKNLDGQQVSLADYKGKAVLINAWATWCPPCKAEMPAIEAYYQAHQAEGFVVLAINDGESQNQVKSFISDRGFTFPVLLDPNASLLNALGIHDFPTSILVGRDGNVKGIHVGMFTEEQLNQEAGVLLK
jgi:peroxiredoxin